MRWLDDDEEMSVLDSDNNSHTNVLTSPLSTETAESIDITHPDLLDILSDAPVKRRSLQTTTEIDGGGTAVVKSPVSSSSQSIFSFITYPWTLLLTVKDFPTSFLPYLISLVLSYSTMFRHIPFPFHMTHG